MASEVLTPRERQIARLVADGQTDAQIAEALGIARGTVKSLLRIAFSRVGVSNRAQLVYVAMRYGWID